MLCMSVSPFVSNKRLTAEPIGPKFCEGPHMAPGKVYGKSKLEEKNSCKTVVENSLI